MGWLIRMGDLTWAKTLAGVFVEPRPPDDAKQAQQRHLAAVSSSEAFRAPALVVVSLIQRPTRAELAAIVDAAGITAEHCAEASDKSSGRTVVGGIEVASRRGWKPKPKLTAVDGSRLAEAVRTERPEAVVLDPACFRAIPENWLVDAAIAGIGRGDEAAAYTGLFAIETRARFPNAKVWAGSIEELTADRTGQGGRITIRRRSPGEALAEGLIGLLAE